MGVVLQANLEWCLKSNSYHHHVCWQFPLLIFGCLICADNLTSYALSHVHFPKQPAVLFFLVFTLSLAKITHRPSWSTSPISMPTSTPLSRLLLEEGSLYENVWVTQEVHSIQELLCLSERALLSMNPSASTHAFSIGLRSAGSH